MTSTPDTTDSARLFHPMTVTKLQKLAVAPSRRSPRLDINEARNAQDTEAMNFHLERADAAVKQLEEELTILKRAVSGLSTAVSSSDDDISSINEHVDYLQAETNGIKETVKAAADGMKAIENEISISKKFQDRINSWCNHDCECLTLNKWLVELAEHAGFKAPPLSKCKK
jgi:septal ring factor EnvC (AmiA/AmiB activator)